MIATTVSLANVQDAIARAISQAPAARARIERAAVLIGLGAVEKVDETTYRVASQSGPARPTPSPPAAAPAWRPSATRASAASTSGPSASRWLPRSRAAPARAGRARGRHGRRGGPGLRPLDRLGRLAL